MRKSELIAVLDDVQRQLRDKKITQKQYDDFMAVVHEQMIYHALEDPVWEKPRRPITAARPHKRGRNQKNLHSSKWSANL